MCKKKLSASSHSSPQRLHLNGSLHPWYPMWMLCITLFLKAMPQNLQEVWSANISCDWLDDLLMGIRLGIAGLPMVETSSSELVSLSNLWSLKALPFLLFLVVEELREGLEEWLLGLLPDSLSLELPCDPPPMMVSLHSLLRSRTPLGDSPFSANSDILLAYSEANISVLSRLFGGNGASSRECGDSLRNDSGELGNDPSFLRSSMRALIAGLGTRPCRRGLAIAILLKYAKLEAGKLPLELIGDSGRSGKSGLGGNGDRGEDGLLVLVRGEKERSSEERSGLGLVWGEERRRCRAPRSVEACSDMWFLYTSEDVVENSHLSHRRFSVSSIIGGETPLSSFLIGSSSLKGDTWAIFGGVPNWLCSCWSCIWAMKLCGKFGKLGKLGRFGKLGGNWGRRVGNIPWSSRPPLGFFGPRLLPNGSTIDIWEFGLPSLLRTIAGLWLYFFRWSFNEWQYLVAYLQEIHYYIILSLSIVKLRIPYLKWWYHNVVWFFMKRLCYVIYGMLNTLLLFEVSEEVLKKKTLTKEWHTKY